jgi:serine/threonine-protein kinase
LDDSEIGHFDFTTLLLNPSRQEVQYTVHKFFSESFPPDVLLLYIIGHGLVEKTGDFYLATVDSDVDRLHETAVSAQYINSEIDQCQSQQKILIFDCAFASLLQSESAVAKDKVDIHNVFKGNEQGRVILYGENKFHYIQEGQAFHSATAVDPLTPKLIDGLTIGDADFDHTDYITVDNLFSYISRYQTLYKWSYLKKTSPILARKSKKPLYTYDAYGNQITHQLPETIQTRALDAAIAREVVLGIPTELVAQVRLKSSPGLKGILELDIDYDPQPEDVKSRSIQLVFPLDEQQKPQGIFLLLKVSSHDFKPPDQTKKIIVPPDADSEPCIFQLIPLRAGQLGLLLEVYDTDEVVTASTKIRVNCQENQATVIGPENRILVSLPLATTVRPFSETNQAALQKRWEELIEEYKAVMVQIGYESNSANKLKFERQASVISDEIKKVEQQLREKNALPANIDEHQEVINVLGQAIMAVESGDFDRVNYQPGQILFDKYKIICLLGRGGMGKTYLAESIDLQRLCVLKTVLRNTLDKRDWQRIQHEARIMEKIKHPHLPQIYSAEGFMGKRPYLVMEYIEGETLREKKAVTIDDALLWLKQLLGAIQHIHQQGIIHCDIHPQNICIQRNSNIAFLLDFGIARRVDSSQAALILIARNRNFAPIEQHHPDQLMAESLKKVADYVRELQQQKFHTYYYTDIYALAATFYFVLTNRLPTNPGARVLGESLELPHVANPMIPGYLSAVLTKALGLHPRDRYQTAQEMLDALQQEQILPPTSLTRIGNKMG